MTTLRRRSESSYMEFPDLGCLTRRIATQSYILLPMKRSECGLKLSI